jgi:hypothetical protein
MAYINQEALLALRKKYNLVRIPISTPVPKLTPELTPKQSVYAVFEKIASKSSISHDELLEAYAILGEVISYTKPMPGVEYNMVNASIPAWEPKIPVKKNPILMVQVAPPAEPEVSTMPDTLPFQQEEGKIPETPKPDFDLREW